MAISYYFISIIQPDLSFRVFTKRRNFQGVVMKLLVLIISLLLSAPVYAADSTQTPAPAPKAADDAAKAPEKETPKTPEPANPRELSCKYYTVTMPDDWKAIVAPTDQQGNVNAIFAKNSGTSQITMIIGPNSGANAKDIADLFSEQFKSSKPPVEKNGQYCFNYTQINTPAQACINVAGDNFLVLAISGNQKEAQNFLKNAVKEAEDYKDLIPN